MSKQDNLVKLYTGSEVIVGRIITELEMNGVVSIVKDGFKQGILAGFGGGVPSAIDIFVTENDFEKAHKIVFTLT